MKKTLLVLLVPLFAVLAGCSTLPEIPYDRMTAGEIKSIGIVSPKFPNEASVILATSVGQSFGLVGALVDAGLQEGRENSFKKMVQTQNFAAQDVFMQRLSAALQEHGYTLSDVSATRRQDNFVDKYPAGSSDAYLDMVVVNYGYIAAGIGDSTPYRPMVSVKVRLVRATDSSVLMQDTVLYNPYNVAGGTAKAVTISPNPSYEFTTFDDLEEKPEMAVKGLEDAIHQSAAAVANLLR